MHPRKPVLPPITDRAGNVAQSLHIKSPWFQPRHVHNNLETPASQSSRMWDHGLDCPLVVLKNYAEDDSRPGLSRQA